MKEWTGAAGLAGLRELVASQQADIGSDTSVLVLNTEGPTDPAAYERITGIAVEGR